MLYARGGQTMRLFEPFKKLYGKSEKDSCDFFFFFLGNTTILGRENREIRDRFEVKTFFLKNTEFGTKSGKSEDGFKREPFFFREHQDFGTRK